MQTIRAHIPSDSAAKEGEEGSDEEKEKEEDLSKMGSKARRCNPRSAWGGRLPVCLPTCLPCLEIVGPLTSRRAIPFPVIAGKRCATASPSTAPRTLMAGVMTPSP